MTSERKIILLLSALHQRGFEWLRLSAGISPSWLHWRYEIAPVTLFSPDGETVRDELFAFGAAGSSDGIGVLSIKHRVEVPLPPAP